MCCDLVWIQSRAVVVLAHCGEVIVLTLHEDHWEELNLTTDHLIWPGNFECECVCMSELTGGLLLVAAYCSEEVSMWEVRFTEKWTNRAVCSFHIPHVCSLTLKEDLVVAATSHYQLIIWYDCVISHCLCDMMYETVHIYLSPIQFY